MSLPYCHYLFALYELYAIILLSFIFYSDVVISFHIIFRLRRFAAAFFAAMPPGICHTLSHARVSRHESAAIYFDVSRHACRAYVALMPDAAAICAMPPSRRARFADIYFAFARHRSLYSPFSLTSLYIIIGFAYFIYCFADAFMLSAAMLRRLRYFAYC